MKAVRKHRSAAERKRGQDILKECARVNLRVPARVRRLLESGQLSITAGAPQSVRELALELGAVSTSQLRRFARDSAPDRRPLQNAVAALFESEAREMFDGAGRINSAAIAREAGAEIEDALGLRRPGGWKDPQITKGEHLRGDKRRDAVGAVDEDALGYSPGDYGDAGASGMGEPEYETWNRRQAESEEETYAGEQEDDTRHNYGDWIGADPSHQAAAAALVHVIQDVRDAEGVVPPAVEAILSQFRSELMDALSDLAGDDKESEDEGEGEGETEDAQLDGAGMHRVDPQGGAGMLGEEPDEKSDDADAMMGPTHRFEGEAELEDVPMVPAKGKRIIRGSERVRASMREADAALRENGTAHDRRTPGMREAVARELRRQALGDLTGEMLDELETAYRGSHQ